MATLLETSTSAMPDLDKLIRLFTGPNSASLHERHSASLERLCSSSSDGFALKDLPKVQQIVELTFELLRTGVAGFLEPACTLLRTLGKPFVKTAATDEFKLLGNATSILKALGKAFEPGFPAALQLAVAEMLRGFATAHGPRPSALELAASAESADAGSALHQYLTNQGLIASSGVARAVIRGLATAIMVGDESLILSLSITLLSFSYMPSNCSQLVQMGILTCVPDLLSHGYKHEIASVAVEFLWNLLEKAPETKQQVLEAQPSFAHLVREPAEAETSQQPAVEAALESTSHTAELSRPKTADPSAGEATSGGSRQSQRHVQISTAPDDTYADPPQQEERNTQQTQQSCDADVSPAAGADADARPGSSRQERPVGVVPAPRLAKALTDLFLSVLAQGFREVDKEMRNNVMVVINLVLDASPQFVAACHESGLFQAVLAVSCAPECCDGSPHVKPWALTTDEVDLELKLLCWHASTTGCVMLPEVLEVAKASGLMSLLLQYLDVVAPQPAVQRWNADRCSSLRSAALTVLHRVAPISVEQYLSNGSVAVVLSLLSHCPVPVHVEAALRHLHVLCVSAPEMAEALGEAGAIAVLLDLIQGTVAEWPESLRQASLQLLALICSLNEENRRRLRKAQGVTALLAQLANVCDLDPTLPSPFALAVFDALWSGIVPDRKNLARFLVSDGMDMLFKLLERGNKGHRPMVLSILADMLENPRSHSFFHEWRSDRDKQPAAHLLISLWREEDALRGMTVDGVLTNTAQPLRGLDKRTRWVAPEAIVYGNMLPERKAQLQAIMEACTGESMLAKIYSVLKLIGMGNLSYISLEDQAMICFIEKYVKFKQGEVWRQIKEEFEAEGMRPTAPDRNRLVSGIELSESLARAVKDAQQHVLDSHVGTIKQREAKFFEDMHAQRKLEQDMRFYQKDKSEMTLAELREAKRKKEHMLKNSLTSFHFMDSGRNSPSPVTAAENALASLMHNEVVGV